MSELKSRFAKMINTAMSSGNVSIAHLVTVQSMVPLTCATLIGRNLYLLRDNVTIDPEDMAIVKVIRELLHTQDGTLVNHILCDDDVNALLEYLCFI